MTDLEPRAQAMRDYQTGGGLDDCPPSYNQKQKEAYNWEMHRLQSQELKQEMEKMKYGD